MTPTSRGPDTEGLRHLVERHTRGELSRREFLGRAVGFGLSASAAGVLLDACGSSANRSSSSGSSGTTKPGAGGGSGGKPPTTTLTYRPQNDIANLDPATWVSQEDEQFMDCIYEGLVTYRPGTFDVVKCLAETFEPSKDGLRFHFTLKKGIAWQKGYGEVQASDVKFSYERIAGLTTPKVNSPYAGDWSALETVQVNGPYEGTIVLKQPFAPIMHSTLPATSGKILPEKAVTALGKKFPTNPVGSGPYEFVSWTPGVSAKLKKFANYSGADKAYAAKVPWSAIETRVITSEDTALEAVRTGGVTMAFLETSVVGNAQRVSSLRVLSRPTQGFQFLSISQKNVPNVNIRRAIRSAIDVSAVIEAAYNGKYTRAYGIIPPSMGMGHWAGAPPDNQDISLAKRYLAAAGGSAPSLTLTSPNDSASEAAAQVIAANLGQAGFRIKLEPEDTATYYAIPGNGGGGPQRELNYVAYTTEPDPYWSFIWFTCAQINLWNWCDWCNQPFNNLLNEAIRTYDTVSRDQLYVQAAQLWDKQANIVWIAYPTQYYAGQTWVNPSLRPDGILYLWNTTAS
ncbi:MAG: ABC transporter substrate-binding protein [Acidimicrobiales bacterium]